MATGSKGNSVPRGGGVTANAARSVYTQQSRTKGINSNMSAQERSLDHAGRLHAGKYAHVRTHR